MKHGFQKVGRSFWKARGKGDFGQGERSLSLVGRAMRQERFWAENARISRRRGDFWPGGRDVAAAGMKFAKIGEKIAKVG